MFSSEIFINGDDRGLEIPEPSTPKVGKVPVKFASSSSGQQITHPHGTDGKRMWLHFRSYYQLLYEMISEICEGVFEVKKNPILFIYLYF